MLDTLASDLRFAGRMLRKSPVFTIVAVVVVSLGTGAVTTIYSAMNAMLFRPLPGTAQPERLVEIERTLRDGSGSLSHSREEWTALREGARSFDDIAAWGKATFALASGGEGIAVNGSLVSANYFDVLGVRPALGRFFLAEEDATPLTHPVVVVSEAYWESRLGADSGAVGRTITVNGRPYTLVGVAPREFPGVITAIRVDAWAPLMMRGWIRPGSDGPGARGLRLFGRIREGTTPAAARQELASLVAARAAEEPASWGTRVFTGLRTYAMTGLPEDASRSLLGFSTLLLGAASLVLLIASVNVASMLSARAVARRREMAVRAALGAGRGRLVRQLLTESLLLFALGAGGGIVVAMWTTHALERIPIPSSVAVSLELSPDLRVLAFALVVALLTGTIFGVAPALRASRQDITSRLRDEGAGSGTRRRIASSALIVGQLAMSLVLLVGAGLFLRALDRGARIDPGFETTGVATVHLQPEAWGYDPARANEFFRSLRETLEGTPGVTAVSYANRLPLVLSSSGDEIRLEDAGTRAGGGAETLPIQLQIVDGSFFDVLRLPLVAGRALEVADDERAPRVAVVNETLANRIAPDGDAVGRTFRIHDERITVVGVARDAKYASLGETTPPFAYFPIAQRPEPQRALMVRAAGDPRAMAPVIRRAILAIDPMLPVPQMLSLEEATGIVLFPQRIAAIVTGVLGAVGLLLAAVGLYGVIAFSTSRRTREIGIRIALGARGADVLRMIVGEGMRLAAAGVLVGILLAAAATRLLASLLFDVSPLDPLTFAAMSGLFVVVALLASWLPARRAAAAEPMAALRSE